MMYGDVHLIGPFSWLEKGLSFEAFGGLLQAIKGEAISGRVQPGRFQVMNGKGQTFHVVLYDDGSWRISTPQLELFPDGSSVVSGAKPPHTLT